MADGENGRCTSWWLSEYISKMALAWMPPPPLLPVANRPSPQSPHPIIQTFQALRLGKLLLTVAATAVVGIVFSDYFDSTAGAHQLIVSALMAAFMVLWIGILLRTSLHASELFLNFLGALLSCFSSSGLLPLFCPKAFPWLAGFSALCVSCLSSAFLSKLKQQPHDSS